MPRPRATAPTYRLAPRPKNGPTLYVTWRENGQTQRVSTRTAILSEAETFLNDFVAGLNSPPPAEPTIKEIFEAYQASRKDKVREHRNLIYAGNALLPILGNMSPSSLTEERVENYMKLRRAARVADQAKNRAVRDERYTKATAKGPKAANGITIKPPKAVKDKPLSNATLVRDLTLLRAALNWAVDNQWLARAPKIKMPVSPPARDRWLTPEEYARLIEHAIEPHVRLFCILALHTGARKSAILELTWGRVNLDTLRIDFGPGYANKHRSRYVAINSALLAALQAAAELRTTDFVIEFNGDPIKDIKTGFQAACRRAQLEGVSPHTLRHTAASWMVQSGISYVQVAKFLGNSAQVVETIYAHHAPDHLREAAESLVKVSMFTEH